MKIACDVCKTAAATVICCADEAALCARCDEEVHAANMLAGKHRRLPLHCEAAKIPRCDICQLDLKEGLGGLVDDFASRRYLVDKSSFIFCVEDRALFCQDCDEAIHIATSLSSKHQRLLATGISVGFSSPQSLNTKKHLLKPLKSIVPDPKASVTIQTPSELIPSYWAIDDLLQLSEAPDKHSSVGFGEFSWFAGIGFIDEKVADVGSISAAEVPDMMFFGDSSNENLQRSLKSDSSMLFKKPRIQVLDDEDFFTVPDLG